MKLEELNIKDIIRFKTRLLDKPIEDIGVVKKIAKDDYWNEWLVEIIPFNLKMNSLLMKPTKVRKKLGEYSNFDFTNDESNHNYKLGYEFKLKLSDEFFKRYIEEIGYVYWNNAEEMKNSFNGIDEMEFIVDRFEGPHMYNAVSDVHSIRITDNFIKEFSI